MARRARRPKLLRFVARFPRIRSHFRPSKSVAYPGEWLATPGSLSPLAPARLQPGAPHLQVVTAPDPAFKSPKTAADTFVPIFSSLFAAFPASAGHKAL